MFWRLQFYSIALLLTGMRKAGAQEEGQPRPVRVMWAFLGSIVGAFVAILIREGTFAIDAGGMKYEDLAAVLLSAVGVLVTVFGVILAILAFWGFGQMKTDAVKAAEVAGTNEVREQITMGPLREYPLRRDWKFYRSEDRVGFAGYREQARILVAQADIWNPQLRVWGTQMIERTAAGDNSAISSPARSTAAILRNIPEEAANFGLREQVRIGRRHRQPIWAWLPKLSNFATTINCPQRGTTQIDRLNRRHVFLGNDQDHTIKVPRVTL
jgi:hypothetical protein